LDHLVHRIIDLVLADCITYNV